MRYTSEVCPYVYIRKPSLLLGVIQCMLGTTGFLLFPWLPGTTNLQPIAFLLIFILQLVQNMYYNMRIHGLQYMEISWKQLGLTAVLAFICGILTAISYKGAYMQQSGAVFCITAVTAILQLWSGFHLHKNSQGEHGQTEQIWLYYLQHIATCPPARQQASVNADITQGNTFIWLHRDDAAVSEQMLFL